MTARFRNSLMAAALFGLATLGTGRPAEAALRLNITVFDGSGNQLATTGDLSGPLDTLNGISSIGYAGVLGGVLFDFHVRGSTNEPGTASQAFLNLGARLIDNQTAQERRILVTTTATGYSAPTTAPLVERLSATVNVLNGTFTGDDATATGYVADPGREIFTGKLSASGLSQPDEDSASPILIMTDLPATFTMVTRFGGKLGANSSVGTGTDLSGFDVNHQIAPVPEPSTIAMAGLGVVLSLGALRRRNRA